MIILNKMYMVTMNNEPLTAPLEYTLLLVPKMYHIVSFLEVSYSKTDDSLFTFHCIETEQEWLQQGEEPESRSAWDYANCQRTAPKGTPLPLGLPGAITGMFNYTWRYGVLDGVLEGAGRGIMFIASECH